MPAGQSRYTPTLLQSNGNETVGEALLSWLPVYKCLYTEETEERYRHSRPQDVSLSPRRQSLSLLPCFLYAAPM